MYLSLAIGGLFLPTAFASFSKDPNKVVPLSRGCAVVLLLTYGVYVKYATQDRHVEEEESCEAQPEAPKLAQDTSESATPEKDYKRSVRAMFTGLVSAILAVLCAEFMISAIGEDPPNISHEFIGLILLPNLVSNIPEHVTYLHRTRNALRTGGTCFFLPPHFYCALRITPRSSVAFSLSVPPPILRL